MASLRSLGKATLIYGLGGILNRLISFLLLPLFTHHLSPVDYGIAAILQIVSLLATPVFSLGLGAALAPCYFKETEPLDRRAVVGTACLISVVSVAVLITGVAAFAQPITVLLLDTAEHSDLLILQMLTVGVAILSQPFMLTLQFEERARGFIALSLGGTMVTATLCVVAVASLSLGLWGWLAATLAGQVLQGIAFAVAVHLSGRLPVRFSFVRRLLAQGLPIVPSFAFIYIMQQGNRFFMELQQGLKTLGIYTVGMSLGMVMSLFTTAFQSAWLPYFMRFVDQPLNVAERAIGRVSSYYFIGFGSLALCFFIFAKPAVELMVNPRFRAAEMVVGLAALAALLQGACSLLTPPQYFGEKLGHVSLLQGIGATLSLLLNWACIATWGLVGGGIALAASYGCLFLLHLFWNCRGWSHPLRIRYEWPRLFVFGFFFALVAAYFLMGPTFRLAGSLVQSFVAIFLLGLVLWKLLSSEERQTIKRLWTKTACRNVIPANHS